MAGNEAIVIGWKKWYCIFFLLVAQGSGKVDELPWRCCQGCGLFSHLPPGCFHIPEWCVHTWGGRGQYWDAPISPQNSIGTHPLPIRLPPYLRMCGWDYDVTFGFSRYQYVDITVWLIHYCPCRVNPSVRSFRQATGVSQWLCIRWLLLALGSHHYRWAGCYYHSWIHWWSRQVSGWGRWVGHSLSQWLNLFFFLPQSAEVGGEGEETQS
jgi:hypothetical protein